MIDIPNPPPEINPATEYLGALAFFFISLGTLCLVIFIVNLLFRESFRYKLAKHQARTVLLIATGGMIIGILFMFWALFLAPEFLPIGEDGPVWF